MHTLVLAFVFAIAVMFAGVPALSPVSGSLGVTVGSAALAQDSEDGEDGDEKEGEGDSESEGNGDGQSDGDSEDGDSEGSDQTGRGGSEQGGQGKAWYQFW